MQASAIRAGAKVGIYEVLRVAGHGATSTVYEALDKPLARRVALRIPRWHGPANGDDERAVARFWREASAAAGVRHPHRVEVFDLGEADGVPFLATEFVDGEALTRLLEREAALTPATAVELLLPILSAVADLHSAGMVHRDIKPSSILLPRAPACPKLSDCGFGHCRDESASIAPSQDGVATSAYTAPEIALFSPTAATERSDQYSLGATVYECASGDEPFRGATPSERWDAAPNARLEPPSLLEPSLPKAFDEVVLRALARDPDERFASVADFARALLPFAAPDVAARWHREFELPSHGSTEPVVVPCASDARLTSAPRRATESRWPTSTTAHPASQRVEDPRTGGRIVASTGCTMCFLRPVFFVRWTAPKATDLPNVRKRLEAAHQRHGGPVIYVAIVPAECKPPDDETRSGFVASMPEILEGCETMHFVMEGQGFKNAILRTSLAAVLLVRGQRSKVFVHGTLEEALTAANERASNKSQFLMENILRQAREAGIATAVEGPNQRR